MGSLRTFQITRMLLKKKNQKIPACGSVPLQHLIDLECYKKKKKKNQKFQTRLLRIMEAHKQLIL